MLSRSTRFRLETQLEALPLIMGSTSPSALATQSPSSKWSAAQNVAHLARVQEVFLNERIRRILDCGQRSSHRRKRLDIGEAVRFLKPKPRLPKQLTVHLESECLKQFRWYVSFVFISTHPLPQFRRTLGIPREKS